MNTSDPTAGEPSPATAPGARHSDQDRLASLFALSREVTGVLDLDELLTRIPRLIARLTPFGVFSVYLLDDASQTLRIAYAEGYPEEAAKQCVSNWARAPSGRPSRRDARSC